MKHKPRQRNVVVVAEDVVNVVIVVVVVAATERLMPFQGSFNFLNIRGLKKSKYLKIRFKLAILIIMLKLHSNAQACHDKVPHKL